MALKSLLAIKIFFYSSHVIIYIMLDITNIYFESITAFS